ncbi:MAG: hypothetical protein KJ623_04060 [Nanoarchaeota archaeon]|nr:hypothetical protein [Nanoarchaeota archaeon]MBU0962985.1 hypothetical protein [Nanoarchaeota archaeon]
MSKEEGDEDIYEEKDAEALKEGDEISEAEEGIMEGQNEDLTKCAVCGKIIPASESPIELEIDGEHYFFCSTEHAEAFKKQHQK